MSSRARGPKIPPYSIASEKAVLGFMLCHPDEVDAPLACLESAEAFFGPHHAALFDAITAIETKKIKGGFEGTFAALEAAGLIESLGGEKHIRAIADAAAPNAEHAQRHARAVREKLSRRKLIDTTTDILHDAYHDQGDFNDILRHARKRFKDLRLLKD